MGYVWCGLVRSGCIHTVEEATEHINKIGFLPLFKNDIPGFSLEERTVPEYWWCDDVDKDPWIWRTVIARGKDIVYGKFFDKESWIYFKEMASCIC